MTYHWPEIKVYLKDNFSVEEIHDSLAERLGFPEYYGKNWDAFEECINDKSQSDMPETLVVIGWHHFVKNHEKDAKLFWSCIEDYMKVNIGRKVLTSYRPCPCCGYLTLTDYNEGSWELCDVCGWEDDEPQFRNPDFEGGANISSLNQARSSFAQSSRANSVKGRIRDFRWKISS